MKNSRFSLKQFRFYKSDNLFRWMVNFFVLLFMLSVTACTQAINTETPTPLKTQEVSTPIPTDGSYDWRGTKLTLSQPLPESPVEANVYSLKSDQYATINNTHSNIQRLGGDGIIIIGELANYDLTETYDIISTEEAFQKILMPYRPSGLLEQFKSKGGGGGGGGTGFHKLNLSGTPVSFPSSTPTPSENPYSLIQSENAPTATLEKVELVYYVRDPYAEAWDPISESYIQPVWRFYGHYSNGDEFEILIQALKEEFLLPELAPYTPPG